MTIQQIDPAELSPGEFSQAVVDAAAREAKVIVIDSLNGYMNAVPDERFLTTHLHELLTYLGQRGVVTILVGVQPGVIGSNMSTTVDASYIADSVIMLRYFEARGKVRQAISVFKKRVGRHERTIRLFAMSENGIQVGDVLTGFHGILTGVPDHPFSAAHTLRVGQPLSLAGPCIVFSNGSDLQRLGGTNTECGFNVLCYVGLRDNRVTSTELATYIQAQMVILTALAGFRIVSVGRDTIRTLAGSDLLTADIAVTTTVAL